ncbi:hypothetical protein CDAR_101481 [Caerostris darwini]|uniref:Uncharacterized protein n=1 Tax=Caerostris darwini TaxID=1538125 RepID=A0AAV4W5Q1_9ARAC|nr:hypothetical protein CDAR_101481 [Caerostris darwini]
MGNCFTFWPTSTMNPICNDIPASKFISMAEDDSKNPQTSVREGKPVLTLEMVKHCVSEQKKFSSKLDKKCRFYVCTGDGQY